MSKTFRKEILNAANLLSLTRIALTPLVAGLILSGHMRAALVLFLAASFTDVLDGLVARRFSLVSEFGARIDPLADKILLSSILIILTVKGFIPPYLSLLVVARNSIMLIVIPSLSRLGKSVEITPSLSGKAATLCQVVAIGLTLYQNVGFSLTTVFAITAIITMVSAIEYSLRLLHDWPAVNESFKNITVKGRLL
jgi:cardiolipin synthase